MDLDEILRVVSQHPNATFDRGDRRNNVRGGRNRVRIIPDFWRKIVSNRRVRGRRRLGARSGGLEFPTKLRYKSSYII